MKNPFRKLRLSLYNFRISVRLFFLSQIRHNWWFRMAAYVLNLIITWYLYVTLISFIVGSLYLGEYILALLFMYMLRITYKFRVWGKNNI